LDDLKNFKEVEKHDDKSDDKPTAKRKKKY